jgi:hypothetical protein
MEDNQVLQDQIQRLDAQGNRVGFEGLFNVRASKPEDHNFIMSTFLRGVYYGESFFSQTPKDLFMDRYKRVVQALVVSPDVFIAVACLPEDPDIVLGYAILSRDLQTVSFVFTKKAWRGKGIARSLIPKDFKYIVPQHVTSVGRKILNNYNVIDNPFF